ncbi:MAG: hypothetical protein U0359_19180 [Byssovorax sp.]
MTHRFPGLAASAIALLAFAACGGGGSSSSTTSSTTTGSTTTGTAAGGGGSGGSSTTTGAGGGGGGGPACVSCAAAITPGANPDNLPVCDGTSKDLYDALTQCTCMGACMDVCSDNVCMGSDVSADCQTCVTDTAAGCGNEFNECSNDF